MVVTMLNTLIRSVANSEIPEVVMCMAYRDRLNVFANVLNRTYGNTFGESQHS